MEILPLAYRNHTDIEWTQLVNQSKAHKEPKTAHQVRNSVIWFLRFYGVMRLQRLYDLLYNEYDECCMGDLYELCDQLINNGELIKTNKGEYYINYKRFYMRRVNLSLDGYVLRSNHAVTAYGRYFGIGMPLYEYIPIDESQPLRHVRAMSRDAAKYQVLKRHPNAVFFN